jgi:hypothetical protein
MHRAKSSCLQLEVNGRSRIFYAAGIVSLDDLAAVLRARQAATLARSISRDGVTIMVRMVAKASPKAIAVASCCHHWVDGAPSEISRVTKSILTRVTMGRSPKTVVAVVSSTGRRRCAPVRMIASMGDLAVNTRRRLTALE